MTETHFCEAIGCDGSMGLHGHCLEAHGCMQCWVENYRTLKNCYPDGRFPETSQRPPFEHQQRIRELMKAQHPPNFPGGLCHQTSHGWDQVAEDHETPAYGFLCRRCDLRLIVTPKHNMNVSNRIQYWREPWSARFLVADNVGITNTE